MPILKLTIPKDVELPTFFETSTPEENYQVLLFGSQLVDASKTIYHASKDIEFSKKLDKLKTDYSTEIESLKTTQHELNKKLQLAERNLTTIVHEERTRILSETKVSSDSAIALAKETTARNFTNEIQTLKTQISELETRKSLLEKDRLADLERERQSVKDSMMIALSSKQAELDRVDAQLRSLMTAHTNLEKQYCELNDFLRRKIKTSKEKGSEYETIFRDFLVKAYGAVPGFNIREGASSATGHEGDFLIKFHDNQILFEIKDYSSKVPTSEVDKFIRDMRENPEVKIGVMISRSTDITGKTSTGDRHFEFVDDKLFVFLSKFQFMGDELDILQSLRPMFEVWIQTNKDKHSISNDVILHDLQKLSEDAVKRKTDWKVHKSRMNEAIVWMSDAVEESEEKLSHMIKKITGSIKTLDIPENIFSDLSNEREELTAQTILKLINIEEGKEITVASLSAEVAKALSISTHTATERIKSIIHPSILHTPKGKPHTIKNICLKS
jgi:hypothetical protein